MGPTHASVTERGIREIAITQEVRRLHDRRCEVCQRLGAPAGPHVQVAHVRPLGSLHDGPDVAENVLCLCPNHHVLLDTGAFAICDNLTLVGLKENSASPRDILWPESISVTTGSGSTPSQADRS
jgi:predicted restriction endonuclease